MVLIVIENVVRDVWLIWYAYAIGIAESINSRTARIGTLILEDLRDFIRAISEGKTRTALDKIIGSLQGVCHLGKKVKHKKLKALANEILNDWDAVVAAVNNPDLPLTNNEAERAKPPCCYRSSHKLWHA